MAKYVELGPGQWRIDMRNTSYAGPKEQLFKGTEAEAADELKRRIEETQRRDSRDGALLPNQPHDTASVRRIYEAANAARGTRRYW